MTISINHRFDGQLEVTANGLVICVCPTMDHAILVCTAFRVAQDWANCNNILVHPHMQEGFLKLIQYDYDQRKAADAQPCRACELNPCQCV